uniref:Aquaporin n=1 Tax=Hirondellea gigas TaxID=1518452 RepID=A0A2P2ID47_9CRUS
MSRHITMRQMLGLAELRTTLLYKAVAAEFLGTLILVLASCASGIHSAGALKPAIATGLTLAALVQALGHVSGCHVNPSVTVGLLCARYTSLSRAVLYILAQVIGGIAGAGLLYGIAPENYREILGVVTKNPALTESQAFGTEVVLTFIFVFVVVSVSDEHRTDIKGSVPLAIGLTLLTTVAIGIPLSGGCLNPARALGPAIITGFWSYHWVYWTGPLLGAVLGSITYSFIFSAPKVEHQHDLISDNIAHSSGTRY